MKYVSIQFLYTIKQLELINFRLFSEKKIDFDEGINLLCGLNTCGKTSILESIWLLSCGSSFRTRNLDELIHHQPSDIDFTSKKKLKLLSINASVIQHDNEQDDINQIYSFRRLENKNSCLIDNVKQKSMIKHAKTLSTLLITPESLMIISGTPQQRRQRIHWGCFYHFPLYGQINTRYQRALKQRNRALKLGLNDEMIRQWDGVLAREACFICDCQQQYIDLLNPCFKNALFYMVKSINVDEVCLTYKGSLANKSVQELSEQDWLHAYYNGLTRDRLDRTTHIGPHRADFELKFRGSDLASRLSRGELKVVASAFLLAQAMIMNEALGIYPMILIDDFSSELDDEHRKRYIDFITTQIKNQVVISAVHKNLLPNPNQGSFNILQLK